jgi:peptidoglycan/LPS O-acetylase OafA/YrhL
VFFLAWGVRARRALFLGIGLASTALSAATLRQYFPIGPRWAFLTVCGAILVGAALWIHRRLRSSPGGVWRGLTAAPLYSGGEGGVSPLAALGAHLAGPASPPPPESGGLTTGGGSYGGGGASGGY